MQAHDDGVKRNHLPQQVGRLILARHVVPQDDSATHHVEDVVMLKANVFRLQGCQPACGDGLGCHAVNQNPRVF